MAKKADLDLNHGEIRKFLKSDGVVEALYNEAELILSEAQRLAPVDSGDYRNGLDMDEDVTDRAVVRVVASDPKSVLIESQRGVLARAIRGKARSRSRDRARERAADRRHDRQVQAEESGEF